MSTRKTRKYLAYALGEIALIVIGILIALQITNMNDERLEREQEHKYMASLATELDDHITRIKEANEGNRILIADMRMLLDRLSGIARAEPGSVPLSESELRKLFLYSVKSTYWYMLVEFPEGTITQLKNAGGLALVQDQDVVMAILGYDQSIRFCAGMKDEANVYFHVQEESQKDLMNLSLARGAYIFIEEDFLNILRPVEEYEPLVEHGEYLRRLDSDSLQDYYGDVLFYRTSINNLIGCYKAVMDNAQDLSELLRSRYDLAIP